jgi:hypothetical protein
MIPGKTIEELINKHSDLEKDLSSGKIDKKIFAEKSKEYSDLNEILNNAKKYLSFENDKRELEKILNDKNTDEDHRGTKKMINKLKNNSGGILIKFPKKKQDLRMDLPTIGIQTIKDCKKYGLKGIVLKSKKNIFLDKSKSIEFADKNKIFILIK